MKDASASKRSRPNSDLDENDPKRGSDLKEKAVKQKRKKLRKRRSSSSPEEDIIDGFVIASYSSLRSLEIVSSNLEDCVPPLGKDESDKFVEPTTQVQEPVKEILRLPIKDNEETPAVNKSEDISVKDNSNGDASHTEINLSIRPQQMTPEQITDDSSESGNSGKGYICDGESEDEQVPQEKKPKLSLTTVQETKKDIVAINVDLSKIDDEEPIKNEKPFKIDSDTPKVTSSPKSTALRIPSVTFSSSSSLAIPQSSRPSHQSSWLPTLSTSSFKKPLVSSIEPCCGSVSFSGTDAIHQELNNRFLKSHSELERNSQHTKPSSHEMHQHSHLHHHQHQHQHTHYYPSPLLPSSYFPSPTHVPPGVLSPFSAPVPTYSSHMIPPYGKKTGKWCAAHVLTAWKIYYHQRAQGDISKNPHSKLEGISVSKPATAIVPPFSSHPASPGDLGYHSSRLRPSRLSGSPFGKPPILIPRSSTSTATMSTSISAFSTVSPPPLTARLTSSPVTLIRTSPETHGKRSPSSGPPSLYQWLKPETKPTEFDSEKSRDHCKREFQTKSPARPSNFSIQSLAGDRTEIRPSPLSESIRSHSSREHRLCEPRSFLNSALVPSLGSLDKRPMDYRSSAGSIDLNRNSLYPRFEPMHALYSHHVTPHLPGYPYPSSSFLADYHTPGHPLMLGTRDPMASLVGTPDAPFYIRRDFDDRLSGRH